MTEHDHQEPHPHRHHPNRPDSLVSVFANLKGTGLPWRQVLALVWYNLKIKASALRGCCGNYGQPGC